MSKSSLGALNTDKGWGVGCPPGINQMGLTAVPVREKRGKRKGDRRTDRQAGRQAGKLEERGTENGTEQ